MLMKTILNRIEKHKGFVYGKARWSKDGGEIEVPIKPRKNGKAICGRCGNPAPGYDRLTERRFRYVPLWGIPVIFLYAMRRVECSTCGVTVEAVPWATGKSPLTRSFALFLAAWAKRLSWSEVGSIFGTTWNRVYDAVKWVVEYGLEHRDISDVTAIGVDEIQYSRGHKYLTLVYQLNEGARRLLYVGKDRTAKTLLRFFHDCGRSWCAQVRFVCSDMWKPYLKVIAGKAPQALHILDRFHIVANMGKALNDVRVAEARQLKREGYEERLKHTKYCFLKNPENLTPRQRLKLDDVLRYDLRSVRAYLLKESFQLFWRYTSPYWARWYLRKWCARAMRSRLDPIKKFVRTVRRHENLILNWFKAKKEFSSGVVEGLNRKVNLITRKAYGHRNLEVLTIALFHTLGALPEPPMTHRFC